MVKDKPSGPKNKYARSLKFNLSSFSEKPIVKNGYIVALFVFIGLVVAFNLADSYDKSVGNQVTGMTPYSSLIDSSMFETVGSAFQTIFAILFGFAEIIFRLLGENLNVIAIKLALVVLVFLAVKIPAVKQWGEKNGKIIAAIVAVMGIALLPDFIILNLFGPEGGIIRAVVVAAAFLALVFLPLNWMHKWKAEDLVEKIIKLLIYLILVLAFVFFYGIFKIEISGADIPNFIELAFVLIFSVGLVWCAIGMIGQIAGLFKIFGPSVKEAAEETGRAIGAGAEATKRAYENATGRTKEKRSEEVKEAEKKELEEIKKNRTVLVMLFSKFKKDTPEKNRTWLKALGYVNKKFGNMRNIRNKCKLNDNNIIDLAKKYGGIKK